MNTRTWKKTACILSLSAIFLAGESTWNSAQAAWPFQLPAVRSTSAAIGDLDGDGEREIVFGSNDGYVYCLDARGTLRWRYKIVPVPGYSWYATSSPVLVNLDADPSTLEVVIGGQSQYNIPPYSSGKVYILSSTGTPIVSSAPPPAKGGYASVEGGVSVVDADGDGVKEVYFATSAFGASRFLGMRLDGTYFIDQLSIYDGLSSPTAVDANGDGKLEFFTLLSDIYNPEPRGITIRAWTYTGTSQWQYPIPANDRVYSHISPVAVDLNNDGSMELVFGTAGGKVIALNAQTGHVVWQTTIPYSIAANVAVADLNSDGKPEIVVAGILNQTPPLSAVYALDGNGNVVWRRNIDDKSYGFIFSGSPSIADLDNDGTSDIIIGTGKSSIFSVSSIVRLDHRGNIVASAPETGWGTISAPALADLDGDGTLEICYSLLNFNNTSAYQCRNADLTPFQPVTIKKLQKPAPWPMIHHDVRHTSFMQD